MILRGVSLAAIALSGGLLFVNSRPFCAHVPRSHWLSVTEVELRLKEAGLRLRALRVTDERCYAVLADDRGGRMVNLIIHPVTADIVKETVQN